jgi:hypothetical protein
MQSSTKRDYKHFCHSSIGFLARLIVSGSSQSNEESHDTKLEDQTCKAGCLNCLRTSSRLPS